MTVRTQEQSVFRRDRFPIGWPEVRTAFMAYIVLTAVGIGLGFLLLEVVLPAGVGAFDNTVAQWFEQQRTETLNSWSSVWSSLADTPVVVAVAIVLMAGFVAVTRRWNEAMILATGLAIEVATFVSITFIAGRDRPSVERLDPSPPTSSFPSGHTAAAVVLWLGLALLVSWHVRHELIRWSLLIVGALVAGGVGVSRMYRGMHHLTDVGAGVMLGLAALFIAVRIVNGSSRQPTPPPEALDVGIDGESARRETTEEVVR